MKKTIIAALVLLLTSVVSPTMAHNNEDPAPTVKMQRISTLIVNANVTVKLLSNSGAYLQMEGNKSLNKSVEFAKTGDTLIIKAPKGKDLTGAGVIYISANQLRSIVVNSNAFIESMSMLNTPLLQVIMNGACEVNIHTIGEVKLYETKDFTLEESRRVRTVPANILFNEKL